jgi:hypothetical protein
VAEEHVADEVALFRVECRVGAEAGVERRDDFALDVAADVVRRP